ncbi:MAG: hypothetical protein AB7F59_00940 [Bdellovibrionales bacterium]
MSRLCGFIGTNSYSQSWTISDPQTLHLTPESFLPPEFLQSIRQKIGPVKLHITHLSSNKLYIRLTSPSLFDSASERGVLQFHVQVSSTDATALIINRLRAENPYFKPAEHRLRFDENEKGLTMNQMRYFLKGLTNFVLAGGYKKIAVEGVPNYQTLMLYLRMGGFKGANPRDEKLIQLMAYYWRYSRKHLPTYLRPKALEDFTDLLYAGRGPVNSSGQSKLEEVWINYQKTGVLPEEARLLQDFDGEITGTSGSPIGLIVETEKPKHQVGFVNFAEAGLPLFGNDWKQAELTELKLVKELVP